MSGTASYIHKMETRSDDEGKKKKKREKWKAPRQGNEILRIAGVSVDPLSIDSSWKMYIF